MLTLKTYTLHEDSGTARGQLWYSAKSMKLLANSLYVYFCPEISHTRI